MKIFARASILLMIFGLAALQAGCASMHKQAAHAPGWINRGSGAFKDAGAGVFYGVGSVSGASDRSRAVQMANQRARAAIADQLDTYVRGLYNDYLAATLATTGKPALPEQHPELTLGIIAEASVQRVRIVDTWKDPKTGTVYSLARLNLAEIKASLPQISGVDPGLRQYIRSNADQAFEAIQKKMTVEPKEPKELKGK